MNATKTMKTKLTKVKRSTANAELSLMPDANLAAAAMQRQRDSAEAAARLVDAEGPAIGLITAGVLKLCASAFPNAIGAKLVIEEEGNRDVEIHLPVHPALTADHATVATESPRQTRARFRAWWARILEEVHAVETELGNKTSLAEAFPDRVAHDLSLKLGQVWSEMATSFVLESPTEFPEITAG